MTEHTLVNHGLIEHSHLTGRDCLEIDLPAVPEQVGSARRAVADFLRCRAWDDDDADALLLAVGEACNNAVNYGGGQPDSRFCVHCRTLACGCLQIDVRNQGSGFYPDLYDYGQLPEDKFATHGRGFGLMLALADSVQVLAEEGDTVVRLTKSRTV